VQNVPILPLRRNAVFIGRGTGNCDTKRRFSTPEVSINSLSRRLAVHLAVLLLFFAIGAVLTWPQLARLGNGVWGKTWDMYNNLWFFQYAYNALSTGEWSVETNDIFHSLGYDLRADLAHFLLPVLAGLAMKYLIVTVELVYGLLLLLSLAFSGWAAYLLARRFTASHAAAILAGIVWIANPVAVRELAAGSLEVVCSGFFVLAFWALLRLADKPTLGRAAALAGLWLLTGFTNWVMAGMFGLVFLVALPACWRRAPREQRRKLLSSAGEVLLVTIIVALPFIGPLIRGDRLSIDETDAALARIAPDPDVAREMLTTVDESLFALINDSFDPGDFFVAQDLSVASAPLSWWLLFALALLSLADAERRRGWLLAAAGVFLLLACGPYLRWFNQFYYGGAQTPVPLPAWLAYRLVPGFHLFYRPYRFMLPAGLLLIGPVAVGAAYLIRLAVGKAKRLLTAGGLSVLTLGVALSAFHGGGGAFTNLNVPIEYETVIAPAAPRALLEVPFFPLPVSTLNGRAMLAQTRHLRPIFNATLLRAPGWRRMADLAERNSLIGALLDLQLKKTRAVRVRQEDARDLVDCDYDLLLVHTVFTADDPQVESYGRLPHELFLLLDELFGPPQRLGFGLLYRTTETAETGEVVVSDDRAVRLRFEQVYARPQVNVGPAGHGQMEIDENGEGPRVVISVPPPADEADRFCLWVRRKDVLTQVGDLRLEMGRSGEPTPAWRVVLPLATSPQWNYLCLPLEPASGWRPSELGWLRFTSEGGGYLVDIDDAAFIRASSFLE